MPEENMENEFFPILNNQNSDSEGCCPSSNTAVYDIKPVMHLSEGLIKTNVGEIRKISTKYFWKDRLSSWKVRWGMGRMSYTLPPGLYAIGNPDADSRVFVTANYKMSFDRLRCSLDGLDAWILVLDTKGVNVWCAAGKGTFGTNELVNRIKITQLDKIVNHRKLIVPQLGATGVAAHEVKKLSGFAVHFGPVRASDIKEYLKRDLKASEAMRMVRFNFFDRLILSPVEIMGYLSYLLLAIMIITILTGLSYGIGISLNAAMNVASLSITLLIIAYFAGTFLAPVLLPYIPFRSFSMKGAFLGGLVAVFLSWYFSRFYFVSTVDWLFFICWFLIMTSGTSFLAMNFTGSSTYTSLSGVRKEMKVALPLQIGGTVIGLILFVITGYI